MALSDSLHAPTLFSAHSFAQFQSSSTGPTHFHCQHISAPLASRGLLYILDRQPRLARHSKCSMTREGPRGLEDPIHLDVSVGVLRVCYAADHEHQTSSASTCFTHCVCLLHSVRVHRFPGTPIAPSLLTKNVRRATQRRVNTVSTSLTFDARSLSLGDQCPLQSAPGSRPSQSRPFNNP